MTGIRGQVMAGPTCPVQSQSNPCPDRGVTATITVMHPSAADVVTRFTTDATGHFQVALPAGSYVLKATTSQARFCSPLPVEVREGQETRATLQCDTGIR